MKCTMSWGFQRANLFPETLQINDVIFSAVVKLHPHILNFGLDLMRERDNQNAINSHQVAPPSLPWQIPDEPNNLGSRVVRLSTACAVSKYVSLNFSIVFLSFVLICIAHDRVHISCLNPILLSVTKQKYNKTKQKWNTWSTKPKEHPCLLEFHMGSHCPHTSWSIPFTPKSDQFQFPLATAPGILRHTVWPFM